MKKILAVVDFIYILFLLWVVFSFVEIMRSNTMPNPEYWEYNCFRVLLALAK